MKRLIIDNRAADKQDMARFGFSAGVAVRARGQFFLRNLARHATRILLVVMVGGFLGATLAQMAPGFGQDEEELDSRLSRESVMALRQARGEEESLPAFYLHYLGRMVRGDLGESQTLNEPVRKLLAERFSETLGSVAMGLALAWAAGLGLAMAAVLSRSGWAHLAAGLAASTLLCVPAAVLALLFVIAQAPGRLAIGLIVFPKIFQYARNLLLRAASLPHVLTARAKGLGGVRVLVWHILPAAGRQLLALAGISVSLAFAAAIPVEVLCDLPGIGQLAWKAAMGRDLALLVNLTMIVTLITLLANTGAELLARPGREGEA